MNDPSEAVSPTLSLTAAGRQIWPVVVIGAGPAGALAAHELARRAVPVLLIDKATFPRPKVCGGCLGAAAMEVLTACELGNLPEQQGAEKLHALRIHAGSTVACLPLPRSVSISRESLDAALIRASLVAGAHFLPETTGLLKQLTPDARIVELRQGSRRQEIQARVVIAADGLAGALLATQEGMKSVISPVSRVGVGCTIPGDNAAWETGVVTMIYGAGGYVGLVRVEQGRLNIAAALTTDYLRDCGGPSPAVEKLMQPAQFPQKVPWEQARWQGTPQLSRRRQHVAAERLLLVGDTAGYIEPFTGEGMTWALLAARGVVPLACEAADGWSPDIARRWEAAFHQLVQRRQWICRSIARLTHIPWAAHLTVRTLASFPWLAEPILRRIRHGG